MTNPLLYPVPRRVSRGAGALRVPAELPLVMSAQQQALLPVATRFQRQLAAEGIHVSLLATAAGLTGPYIHVDPQGGVSHSQGYRLTVGADRIVLEAGGPAGAAYGLATLRQLLAGARRVDSVVIEDHPDLERRGIMLDISRGKVPTMETLFQLVDFMADLKLNELQLYTEHTFAYQEHREVWQHFSPLTGEEVMRLDAYCRDRFIDLVPNQNSFGHMTQWLIHDRYTHMAETLDGWTGWGVKFDYPFSMAPVEESTIPFLAGLYDELLPHFSSPYFNVGCDETLDVGQGRSRAMVAQKGEHRVYMDQLLKIYKLVHDRGRTMQFWGDIIIKAPELVAELPPDVVPLEWGYEADHPFMDNCAHYAAAGLAFYVCPGASTWNSFVGRTDNALANIRAAAEAGAAHGAKGLLTTVWGDSGHLDYQPVFYLPVAYSAAVGWAVGANAEADTAPYLDRFVFGDRAGRMGRLLFNLGNLYKAFPLQLPNGAVPGYLLTYANKELPQWAAGAVTAADFDKAMAAIRDTAAGLDEVELTCPDAVLIQRELRNSIRLLLHLCQFGKVRLKGGEGARSLLPDLEAIMAEHKHLWLARNRIGGLEEMSLKPLRTLREVYQN